MLTNFVIYYKLRYYFVKGLWGKFKKSKEKPGDSRRDTRNSNHKLRESPGLPGLIFLIGPQNGEILPYSRIKKVNDAALSILPLAS
jgi:hypothetical protein